MKHILKIYHPHESGDDVLRFPYFFKKKSLRSYDIGFTIVELLIVIVVIAILVAITIIAYNGIQNRARYSVVENDFTTLERAIRLAQSNKGVPLFQVTGTYSTGNACWTKPAGTNLATLTRTDACWVNYLTTLTKISEAGGINLKGLVDPWGYPYMIDENETEDAMNPCQTDDVGIYNRPTGGSYGTSINFSHVREISPIGSTC